jgi:hypothetical protein
MSDQGYVGPLKNRGFRHYCGPSFRANDNVYKPGFHAGRHDGGKEANLPRWRAWFSPPFLLSGYAGYPTVQQRTVPLPPLRSAMALSPHFPQQVDATCCSS